MQKLLGAVAAALCLVAVGSCDCPVLRPSPVSDPRVREASITRFDAGWEFASPEDTLGRPVPEFSIHTFQFPSVASSSGSLPNVEEVGNRLGILLDNTQFESPAGSKTYYRAELYSRAPNNTSMPGDIMLMGVNTAARPRTATIRVHGRMALFAPPHMTSGSASDFADYLKQRRPEFPSLRARAELFGPGSGETVAPTYTRIIDASGRIVNPPLPTIPAEVIERQDSIAQLQNAYEITVRVGEVYYYRARNGIEFGVFIEDAFTASLPPELQRMTIKFAELQDRTICEDGE